MSEHKPPIPINKAYTQSRSTPQSQTSSAGSTPPPHQKEVSVYIGDPPVYLFSIPNWEAAKRISRCEAVSIDSKIRRRGILVVAKANKTHTLQGQLQDWAEAAENEDPARWAREGGLAKISDIAGLPVVGKEKGAITLLSEGGTKQPSRRTFPCKQVFPLKDAA